MNDTVVLTYIYNEFWGTEEFRKSVGKLGLPIHNAMKTNHMVGDGQLLKWIYDAYVELRDKYKYAIYSDGADTYFVKNFKVPDDKIIYSAEKAIWPPTREMHDLWEEYYDYDLRPTPWSYLNGGNCCSPIDLMIEFFDRYGITDHVGKHVNGQGIVAEAFIKAKADGFPIELDTNCVYFQTTGFAEAGDFLIFNRDDVVIENLITHTHPAVFHGNGRTPLDWIYNLYKDEPSI